LDEVMPLSFSIEKARKSTIPIVSAAETSTLPNGVRVVSTKSILPGASVGLFYAGGSRFSPKPGMPHILASLALQSSATRSEIANFRAIEELGGQFSTEANRDNIILRADILPNDIGAALEIITDVAVNGSFDVVEVANRVEAYRHQVNEVLSQNVTLMMEDSLHNAAFAGKGLGLPLHALTNEEISALDSADGIKAYRDATFSPEKIVIVGAGVDHTDLLKVAESRVGKLNAGGSKAPTSLTPYVGSSTRTSKSPDGYVHIGLGFGCGGWQSDDVFAACALSMLMGGGGSFSAGGPGKV
jgi:mitochondrial-processing peptidase subunit alpha